ncbi:hypothetical protein D043_0870A, partial [Vibrio parahaemolyticus EKP-021]
MTFISASVCASLLAGGKTGS